MPVAAVIAGGRPSINSGSTSATWAPISGVPPTLNLIFRSGSVITAQSVASLPVPAVVGTATSGGMRLVIGVPPYSYSTIEPPWTTSPPTDFAVSIELPPPRAMRPSQPASTYAARARPTSSISGFARTSSKRTAFSRCASAASARPAATTPLSVTRSGLLTPSSATSSPRRAIAPAPWTIRVGTSTVRTVSTSTLTGRRAYRTAVATDRAASAFGDLQHASDVEAAEDGAPRRCSRETLPWFRRLLSRYLSIDHLEAQPLRASVQPRRDVDRYCNAVEHRHVVLRVPEVDAVHGVLEPLVEREHEDRREGRRRRGDQRNAGHLVLRDRRGVVDVRPAPREDRRRDRRAEERDRDHQRGVERPN